MRRLWLSWFALCILWGLVACRPSLRLTAFEPISPAVPAATAEVVIAVEPAPDTPAPAPSSTIPAPSNKPVRRPTSTPFPIIQESPGAYGHPTLADLWSGTAQFIMEDLHTGLPMGESDTIVLSNGEFWSYLHSSSQHDAGAVDQCGNPVEFPGCTVIYRSYDSGHHFLHQDPPVCQFECLQCPCDNEADHIAQQQYPQLAFDGERFYLVYEHLGQIMLRRSPDGLVWSAGERIADTGIWKTWLRPCPSSQSIGVHPFVPYDYECLAGGPPGIYLEGKELYVFLAIGQSPGGMGCYRGLKDGDAADFRPCENNPLFLGSSEYGPRDLVGQSANPYFDFRTISSATLQKITTAGETRYYMLYEGIRGPGAGDPGDTQFGLGMARSLTDRLDGSWETFPGNPMLVNLPGNIGLGHSDLLVFQGQTILYTSLDGKLRSRLILDWR